MMSLKRFASRLRALPTALAMLWREPTNRGQKLVRTLLFFAWVPTQKWLRPRLIMRMDNGLLIRARTTKVLLNRFEPLLTSFVIEHACPGGIMIDVGASVGIYTLQVAPGFEELICIEPSAPDVTLLHQNLHLNWRELDKFEIHEAAAGEEAGELRLLTKPGVNFVPTIDQGDLTDEELAAQGLARTSVPCRTVDSIVADRTPVHFIKIDVEGFEPQVLRGAAQTITNNPRVMVQLEGIGDRTALFDQTQGLGLTMLRPDDPKLRIKSLDQLDNCRDFFAVGPEHPLLG